MRSLTGAAKAEVERIFNWCFTSPHCGKKDCHNVDIKWAPTNKTPKNLKLGFGGGTLGFNPTSVSFYVDDGLRWGDNRGQTGNFKVAINPYEIREQCDPKKCASVDIHTGVIIAHEIGHHGFGGKILGAGHYGNLDPKRHVDHKHCRAVRGMELSPKACKKMCNDLDIN